MEQKERVRELSREKCLPKSVLGAWAFGVCGFRSKRPCLSVCEKQRESVRVELRSHQRRRDRESARRGKWTGEVGPSYSMSDCPENLFWKCPVFPALFTNMTLRESDFVEFTGLTL
ncbi:hypothetical protein SLA2020_447420 [Shorea laevis]